VSEPRQAATVILLRDGETGPEVLLVKRARGAAFMAEAHVFPGGRLDESDGGDHARAAAREAAEEAGVALDPSQFVYFARWVTPPTEPRRYDTRFFAARLPDGQVARPDPSGEVVDFRWAPPAEFVAMQQRREIQLPPPTRWHLGDLARARTVDEALAWARSRTPVAVRPKLVPLGASLAILLPWDPDYAAAPVAEGEPIDPSHPVVSQPITRFVLDEGHWVPTRVG